MEPIGVRALKQNASAVLKGIVESGEAVTVTDRGRPVAQIVPIADSIVEQKLAEGLARGPMKSISDLPRPMMVAGGDKDEPSAGLSQTLVEQRAGERY